MSKLSEKLEALAKQHATILEYHAKHAAMMAPVYEKLFEIGADFDISNTWSSVSLSGDKHKLAEAVRALRTAGFTTRSEPPKAADSSWNPTFSHPCGAFIFFYFTSTVCRRVKVGTKIEPAREVDVYETVCGEVDGNGEPIAPQPAPADDLAF